MPTLNTGAPKRLVVNMGISMLVFARFLRCQVQRVLNLKEWIISFNLGDRDLLG